MNQQLFVFRKLFSNIRQSERHMESFHEFLEASTEDRQIFQVFNTITGFALSIGISQLSTAAMFRFLKRLHQILDEDHR